MVVIHDSGQWNYMYHLRDRWWSDSVKRLLEIAPVCSAFIIETIWNMSWLLGSWLVDLSDKAAHTSTSFIIKATLSLTRKKIYVHFSVPEI